MKQVSGKKNPMNHERNLSNSQLNNYIGINAETSYDAN